MKRRGVLIVIGANLLVLMALIFAYPQLMVSPGPLRAGHAALATDCFACHAPLHGAAPERCTVCHAVADIGLRTTHGAQISAGVGDSSAAAKTAFHQQLAEPDCMACHSDHASPGLARRAHVPFVHTLLRVDARERCEGCHAAPGDPLHPGTGSGCSQCHRADAWKPSTFAHDRHFVLDKDHAVSCATCHVGNDTTRTSCYGCHAHTPAGIRRKHDAEGVRDVEHCARCHRSAHDAPKPRSGDNDASGRDARRRE